RTTLAITSLVAPQRSLRIFQVPGDGTPAPMIWRMFGIRNGALAVGLCNLDQFRSPRRFVAINVLIDFIDALAFIAAGRRREISRTGRTVTTAVALSAVVAGAVTYASLPPDSTRPGHHTS
ncbi:MAG TPA: hypothetical protein VMZ66_13955, partial [Aeromicrobium sp.]|nr:hypothetical protein [Aeromicrobium sp.]